MKGAMPHGGAVNGALAVGGIDNGKGCHVDLEASSRVHS